MILKRKQKTYSGIQIARIGKYKISIPKHDLIDAKLALEKHIARGGEKEGKRFMSLYKNLAGNKPHKFIQKIK